MTSIWQKRFALEGRVRGRFFTVCKQIWMNVVSSTKTFFLQQCVCYCDGETPCESLSDFQGKGVTGCKSGNPREAVEVRFRKMSLGFLMMGFKESQIKLSQQIRLVLMLLSANQMW